jgi:diacylglycerol kinase family enzyme
MKSLVIVNPRSGDYSINRFITDFTIKKPDWLSADIILIDKTATEKFIKSTISNYDSVIIAGGDGTISRIVSLMSYCENPAAFVPIPIGTGNDFSRFSGWFNIWRKGQFELFFHHLRDAAPNPIDLWDFNGKRFICYVSLGWDAEVVGLYTLIKQKMKKMSFNRRMNTFLYIYCALMKLNNISNYKEKNSLIFSVNKERISHKMSLNNMETIILSNIRSYAGGAQLHNIVDENDKKIDIYYIKNPLEYMCFMLNGRLDFLKKTKPFAQLNNVEINSQISYNFQIDGEWERGMGEKNFFFNYAGQITYLKPFS